MKNCFVSPSKNIIILLWGNIVEKKQIQTIKYMAKELNLDQLSDAMRKQQEGNTNGKKIVWDKDSQTFVELNSNEQANDTQSVVNDVSTRAFYSV